MIAYFFLAYILFMKITLCISLKYFEGCLVVENTIVDFS